MQQQKAGDDNGANAQNTKLEIIINESPHIRAYLRLSGGLVKLINSGQFQALAAALRGEKRSQLTMWQNEGLIKVQEALKDPTRGMSQRCAAVRVITVRCHLLLCFSS